MRRVGLLFLLTVLASAMMGAAASLAVDGGTLQTFEYTAAVPTRTATNIPTPTETATASQTPTPTPTQLPELTATPTITRKDWDKSSLHFTGQGVRCIPAGVWAGIKNDGEPMAGPAAWELYRDKKLFTQELLPALGAGETFTLTFSPSAAGVYKFKVYQRPGHPGKGELWSDEIKFDPLACPTPSPTRGGNFAPPRATPTPTALLPTAIVETDLPATATDEPTLPPAPPDTPIPMASETATGEPILPPTVLPEPPTQTPEPTPTEATPELQPTP